MLSKQFKALTVVLLTMAVATPEMAVPAAAFLPAQVGSSGNSGLNLDNSNLLTEVEYGYYRRKRRHGYNNYYGGNRHSYRRYRYNNYYNGGRYRRYHNYYNDDWPFYGLAFGLGYGLGYGGGYRYYDDSYGYRGGYRYYDDGYYGGGGHVQWCLNRYRSYNPRTNTYMGYDGYRHRCNSPY
jgi:hypothetical protein